MMTADPPNEIVIVEGCDACEGSGKDYVWIDDEHGYHPTREPCRYCDGRGYFEVPSEPVGLEDLVPLIPKVESP